MFISISAPSYLGIPWLGTLSTTSCPAYKRCLYQCCYNHWLDLALYNANFGMVSYQSSHEKSLTNWRSLYQGIANIAVKDYCKSLLVNAIPLARKWTLLSPRILSLYGSISCIICANFAILDSVLIFLNPNISCRFCGENLGFQHTGFP